MAKKNYVLGMFPYPSGDGLHVGHVRIYTAVDVMSRYFRMKARSENSDPRRSRAAGSSQEHSVLAPIGWDAFGLPAENAAIKKKTIPQKIVPQNYNNFRSQMQNLQFAFDWEREFATTDPTYYGLTQWIFLELYKKGLVYREQVPINWCPKCKTGLANEEVLPDGTHERCGTATGKKLLPQWVMKITEYADRLLNDLDEPIFENNQSSITNNQTSTNDLNSKRSLDWPRGILEMQRNWIGKKEGVRLKFALTRVPGQKDRKHKLEVFTTRLDTIEGVTFVVIAPELAKKWVDVGWQASAEVQKYIADSLAKTEQARLEGEKEKSGVDSGVMATNPYNGEEVPVWIADYVLSDFGTGAVMGVPYYDERDREFAKRMGLPVKKIELLNREEVFQNLSEKRAAESETTYHLRDWVFSRQRYWGEPIPLVYCAECAKTGGNPKSEITNSKQIQNTKYQIVKQDGKDYAVVPLSETDLPLTLPELDNYEPTDTGESPLSRVKDWVNTKCPNCGGPAKRETDTMPNWAGSCWYHLAFAFWQNEIGKNPKSEFRNSKQIQNSKFKTLNGSTREILDSYRSSESETPYSDFWKEVAKPAIDKWLPVDWYLGGAEHAVLHLLYARFWSKVLQDLGHLDFSEPYLRLRSVGIVLAEDGRKMSKSWGNVINPDTVVKEFGSDAVRLYEMFMGPWNQSIAWDSRALIGMKRLCDRIVETVNSKYENLNSKQGRIKKFEIETSPVLADKLSKLVKQVEKGILEQKFNTSIAGIMEFLNLWKNSPLVLSQKHVQNFAQILSPFAPKTAQQIWDLLRSKHQSSNSNNHTNTKSKIQNIQTEKVEDMQWPQINADEVEVPVTIAVQVNGKLRSTIQVARSTSIDKDEVVRLATSDERVKKWVTGNVRKTIFVPGRLVNVVI